MKLANDTRLLNVNMKKKKQTKNDIYNIRRTP